MKGKAGAPKSGRRRKRTSSAKVVPLQVGLQAPRVLNKPAPETRPAELLSPGPAYTTDFGAMGAAGAACGMAALPTGSVDLVVTSPPYALHFKKEYGNAEKEAYVEWFRPFAAQIHRLLKAD